MHFFNSGDIVMSMWNNQKLELQLIEKKEPMGLEWANQPVWWCKKTNGVPFNAAEDGIEGEDIDGQYRILLDHDFIGNSLFEQSSYSEIFLKSYKTREWDNEKNHKRCYCRNNKSR